MDAGRRTSLWVAAIGFAIVFFSATLPSPLYPLYRATFGFGGVTLTLIYATYVIGNLAALLFFGRLSDQIGRRLVALPAVAVGVAGAPSHFSSPTRRSGFSSRGR